MSDAAITRNQRHGAREDLPGDLPLHQLADAFEAIGGKAHVFGSRR
jgi:hypothetical protein